MKDPITREGRTRLEEEIRSLKFEKSPAISRAIQAARELGDLSENAEYHAERENQSLVENRIKELELMLANSEVVEASSKPLAVAFGTKVRLLELASEKEETYMIVGTYEANLREHKISFSSPLAKALIGKSKDEIAEVELPQNATKEYKILEIFS